MHCRPKTKEAHGFTAAWQRVTVFLGRQGGKGLSKTTDIARFVWTIASNQELYRKFEQEVVPGILGPGHCNYHRFVPGYIRALVDRRDPQQTFVATIRGFEVGEPRFAEIVNNSTVMPDGSGIFVWGMSLPADGKASHDSNSDLDAQEEVRVHPPQPAPTRSLKRKDKRKTKKK